MQSLSAQTRFLNLRTAGLGGLIILRPGGPSGQYTGGFWAAALASTLWMPVAVPTPAPQAVTNRNLSGPCQIAPVEGWWLQCIWP